MYSVISIATYILKRYVSKEKRITNSKMQKVLYFVQAEFLSVTGETCFKDRILAWDFGPVVPLVYSVFKVFAGISIPPNYIKVLEPCCQPIMEEHKSILNGIIDATMPYADLYLTAIIHNQSPWKYAFIPGLSAEIKPKALLEFFKEETP